MSIAEMIADHPQVRGDEDPLLGQAVRHALFCAAICNSCADACSAEDGDMSQCIRSCSDCSDICTATYRTASRRTAGNVKLIENMFALCIEACERCAEECEKHDNAHCKRCATMCRETIEDCRKALEFMKKAG